MRRGQHMTEESRAKVSAGKKNPSAETRTKMSAAKLGLKASPETRAKMSTAQTGNTNSLGHRHSEETKAKLSVAHTNPSAETRAKMSAAQMGHAASPEARAKMSAARMGKKGSLACHWKGGPSVWHGRQNARRRTLGFSPLNSWFPGCEAHHINNDDVIYMLKAVHRSIRHNVLTGHNMDKINAVAFEYLSELREVK